MSYFQRPANAMSSVHSDTHGYHAVVSEVLWPIHNYYDPWFPCSSPVSPRTEHLLLTPSTDHPALPSCPLPSQLRTTRHPHPQHAHAQHGPAEQRHHDVLQPRAQVRLQDRDECHRGHEQDQRLQVDELVHLYAGQTGWRWTGGHSSIYLCRASYGLLTCQQTRSFQGTFCKGSLYMSAELVAFFQNTHSSYSVWWGNIASMQRSLKSVILKMLLNPTSATGSSLQIS